MTRRFDLLDAWRSLAVVLMAVYHFLYDLYLFGVLPRDQLFSVPLNLLQQFICWSFILLAGASARFTRSNMRRGIILLVCGAVVELGAMIGGQVIRFGILQLLGFSVLIYHFLGRYLRRIPDPALAAGSGVLFLLTRWLTRQVDVPVTWLYPLGFMGPGFQSADYFPLLPWFFLFLIGTVFGGWCLRHRENRLLTMPVPSALTWPGRHSLMIYLLHQPVLYGVCVLIWGMNG